MRHVRILMALLTVLALSVGVSAPANAYAPVNVVHTEHVAAGPYALTIGFSTWPLRAMQSLDFTFIPADGITGKSGTLTIVSPDGHTHLPEPLARHHANARSGVWTSGRCRRRVASSSSSISTDRAGRERARSTSTCCPSRGRPWR
ncbi:Hypothetical protein ERS075661_01127 [Mycobacteroides abscessus]|nr:Hypothetical protein ERS075661_01127 [Mycobacteroides abscessus]